jgi:hypothetical protein
MFMPFHHLKTYIRNPSIFFISFSPSHLEGNADANHDPRAWEVSFAKFLSSFYFY